MKKAELYISSYTHFFYTAFCLLSFLLKSSLDMHLNYIYFYESI